MQYTIWVIKELVPKFFEYEAKMKSNVTCSKPITCVGIVIFPLVTNGDTSPCDFTLSSIYSFKIPAEIFMNWRQKASSVVSRNYKGMLCSPSDDYDYIILSSALDFLMSLDYPLVSRKCRSW